MDKPNYYKLAPTRLYNVDGDSKVFRTQEGVDKAWEEGWYGPPWLMKKALLISEEDWDTKQDMIDAVYLDPRYKGLYLNKQKTVKNLKIDLVVFEGEKGISNAALPDDAEPEDEED